MKVILQVDIKGLGKKNDIKEVNEGYARNFLLPGKKAAIATPQAMEKIKMERETSKVRRDVQDDLLNRSLKELEGKSVILVKKANEHGHLFSAIHADEVAAQMKKEHSIEIDPATIVFPIQIKEIGDFTAMVSIKGKSAVFSIKVVE